MGFVKYCLPTDALLTNEFAMLEATLECERIGFKCSRIARQLCDDAVSDNTEGGEKGANDTEKLFFLKAAALLAQTESASLHVAQYIAGLQSLDNAEGHLEALRNLEDDLNKVMTDVKHRQVTVSYPKERFVVVMEKLKKLFPDAFTGNAKICSASSE